MLGLIKLLNVGPSIQMISPIGKEAAAAGAHRRRADARTSVTNLATGDSIEVMQGAYLWHIMKKAQ
jgi:hypothetical protein